VRGVIQKIPEGARRVSIKHEKIPGYMAAMTMDFTLKNTNELAGLQPGDEITFTLVVTDDTDWIENLRRTGRTEQVVPRANPNAGQELSVGDTLPDHEFTSETGKVVKFSDYRGRAVAFTFFFTSCPLPEYCPRMNKNLAEARRLLIEDTSGPTNWQFLSISFDYMTDQPQILANYAGIYRGTNADRWLFAVASSTTLAALAPKVDLNFWRENGTITHNLRTVVVDGAGKITRQFDGNEWTAPQLAEAIRAAAEAR
jgi:protein SCO1/2